MELRIKFRIGVWVWGMFRLNCLGWGEGLRVQGSWVRVWGWGFGFRAHGLGLRVKVRGLEFRV